MTLIKKTINRLLGKCGYQIRAIPRQGITTETPTPPPEVPYVENRETGPTNLEIKFARLAEGGDFEWPDMVCRNHTLVQMLGDAKRIAELGGGTGCFAYEAAKDDSIFVVCSEFDSKASRWAAENRARDNIRYVNGPIDLQNEDPLDVVVCVDAIEHIADYPSFLEMCTKLAPRAIFSTPDKNRNTKAATAGPPDYVHHVREWTAGEFYWVLRSFYRDVKLYGVFEPEEVGCRPISVTDKCFALIADCRDPLVWNSKDG